LEAEGGKLVGARLKRREDRRFLTGRGSYVDDYRPPGLLHAAFVRSQDSHARILRIDTAEARKLPGVAGVLTGGEMARWAAAVRARSTMPTYKETALSPLAVEKVRHVGEAVAVVVAESRYIAEDALDRIAVDYDPLPPVSDMEAAAMPDAPLLHEEAGTNVIVTREFSRLAPTASGAEGAAAGRDEIAVKDRFRFHRHSAVFLEPRGYVAEYNSGSGVLTLRSSTQCPGLVRSALALSLGIPEHQVRVIAGDVGGGFGAKSSVYPEEIVVAALARGFERPVKWISDRREDLLTSSQGWDEIIDAELTARADGTIVALKADVIADVGAYSIFPWTGVIEPVQTISFMPGPYHVPNYQARARAVVTCKAPTGPYRGVGRPVSTFVMEGLIDRAARRLGMDPAEFRLRNFIRADEFPYKTPTGIAWDRTGFTECMLKAREMIGYEAARAGQAKARAQGRLVGIGFASFAELTGIGSATPAAPGMIVPSGTEAATVRVDPSGTVTAIFGIGSHGQGLETALAQVVAEELEVPFDDVRVIFGDTASSPYGTGSYASRGAVMGGGAAIMAARTIREKADKIAIHLLEADSDEHVVRRGRTWTRQSAGRVVSLKDIAQAAYAGAKRLPRGMEPGLEATRFYDPYYGTTTSATHAAIVEIDPETFAVKVARYVVAEDCGRVINPLIVDGQIHGGVAQGIGGALLEETVYDEAGQLMTGSLMDYLVPTAASLPAMEAWHLDNFSPTSLGGFRGVGESGTIGAPAAIANAIADALAPLGVEPNELPLTPERLFQLCSGRRSGRGAA
jgi:aerobic carbon-monoxide dehydrogenase large subunit